MSGIGDILKTERRRQGRTLADAAAETRVRESYLAAIEEEDFDVLGGDVYARGFIRLYGKYLGLDAEDLVQRYRDEHEKPAEVTAIPGATIDEVMPPLRALPRLAATPPVYTAVGVVVFLVLLFAVFRGGGAEEAVEIDPNAPGPSPAATPAAGADAAADAAPSTPVVAPTQGQAAAVPRPGASATPQPTADEAPAGEDLLDNPMITVTAIEAIQLTVIHGQPPVTGAPLDPGESRNLFDPDGQRVTFSVSDFGAAEITVNGDLLDAPQLDGQAVQITCTRGERACDAIIL